MKQTFENCNDVNTQYKQVCVNCDVFLLLTIQQLRIIQVQGLRRSRLHFGENIRRACHFTIDCCQAALDSLMLSIDLKWDRLVDWSPINTPGLIANSLTLFPSDESAAIFN